MSPSRERVLALLLACVCALACSGCAAWKTSKLPADELLAHKRPHQIRITLADKRQFKMSYPAIRNDSLVGYHGGFDRDSIVVAGSPWKYPRMAFAMADVRGVEMQHIDPVATTFLIIGIGATIALIVGIAAVASMGGMGMSFDGGGDGYSASCPHLSSWDGKRWWLDSGTYGGAILEPLARTDVDELEHAHALDSVVRVRMTDEANETEFVDAVSLLAVDHAAGTGVAPDAEGRLHAFAAPAAPLAARGFDGRDALALVRDADDRSWESSLRPRAAASELTDGLELEFAKPAGQRAVLVLTGHNTTWAAFLVGRMVQAHGSEEPEWQRQAEAHPAETRAAMNRLLDEGMLHVAVATASGWQPAGVVWEAGPEVAKQQALAIDLTRIPGDTVRVRLCSIPSFWLVDRVALARESAAPLVEHTLALSTATDSTNQDLKPLLSKIDGRTYRMPQGTVAELNFQDPPRTAGLERTYVARTSGWYRVGCDTTRAPDHALLARLAHEPHAAARLAVERANQALQLAEEVLR